MKQKTPLLVLAILLLPVGARIAVSHCEIPCGVYGDETRVKLLREHLTTIERSMEKIVAIPQAEKPDWNQLARWVENKEAHAKEIQHIVTQYFMTQRVKVPAAGDAKARERYLTQLTTLHELLVAAMKMKQTTDLGHVKSGRALVDRFEAAYFTEK